MPACATMGTLRDLAAAVSLLGRKSMDAKGRRLETLLPSLRTCVWHLAQRLSTHSAAPLLYRRSLSGRRMSTEAIFLADEKPYSCTTGARGWSLRRCATVCWYRYTRM